MTLDSLVATNKAEQFGEEDIIILAVIDVKEIQYWPCSYACTRKL